MGRKQENKVYVESLSFLSEGHVIWPETWSDDLKPGAVGYVNGYGVWNTIAHLTDGPEEVKAAIGVDGPKGLDIKDIPNTSWELKKSKYVSGVAIDLRTGIPIADTPVTADAGAKYTCSSNKGAMLLAKGDVTLSQLRDEAKAEKWVTENLEKIIGQGSKKNIETRGVWLVTQTYHTPVCAKRVFQQKDSTATIHVGTEVLNMAQVNGTLAWWAGDSASGGWNIHRGPNEKTTQPTQPPQPPQQNQNEAPDKRNVGVVMCVGGIWWRPGGFYERQYVMEVEKERQQYLGQGDDEHAVYYERPGVDDDDAYLKLCPLVVSKNTEIKGIEVTQDTWTAFSDGEDTEEEESSGQDRDEKKDT